MYKSDRLKMNGPLILEYFDPPQPGNLPKSPYLDPTKPLDQQTWVNENIARLIYDEQNGVMWFGDSIVTKIRTLCDIPSGEKVVFDTALQQFGYTLLTNITDGVIYYTRGSAAGGEAGGSLKSGGSWTSPPHSHVIGAHTHNLSSHTHTLSNHQHLINTHNHGSVTAGFTLTIATMPSHRHPPLPPYTAFRSCGGATGRALDTYGCTTETGDVTGKVSHSSHTHLLSAETQQSTGSPSIDETSIDGESGSTGSNLNANSTNNTAFSSWRPYGRNFTRQQRN